jgi:cell shape-determining protein MreC
MKTNFLPKNSFRKKQSGTGRLVLIIASVFILGVLFFSYLGGYLSNLFIPLWNSKTFISSGAENLFASLRSKDALISENNKLRENLASDEELIVSLRAIASSRDDLISSFGRSFQSGIPASVLVHPPETPYDIILVDAGESLGVRPQSEVTTPEGVSIGIVSDIFSRSARVKLYSTAGERTDAVLERGSMPVTLIGRGGGNLEFTLPRDKAVMVGDRILTPNLAASLVAVVGEIDVSPTDSFKTIFVRSPINPSEIRHVVIKR